MNATLSRLTRFVVDLRHETDARLIDRFLGGCELSFRELVSRHGSLVFGVCNHVLRHRQDAEDAFQAVFLVLARRAGDVWPREAVGSWLYGVAHRVALKARVTRARRNGREQPLEETPQSVSPSPEPDTAVIIERVVKNLPEVYRAAVVACDLEGLSRRDAAGQLGWTEGTLSGRLARARKILANRLRKAGVSLPAGGIAAVLAVDTPANAKLQDTVLRLISITDPAIVAAPVAALTEGVVPGMLSFKLKSIATALLVTCALGYGAWSADAGSDEKQQSPATITIATQPKPAPEAKPKRPDSDASLLDGRWRLKHALFPGGAAPPHELSGTQEFEIHGTSLVSRTKDASGNLREQTFRIAVGSTTAPKTLTIDFFAAGKPVAKGIFDFRVSTSICAKCHTGQHKIEEQQVNRMILCDPGVHSLTEDTPRQLRLAINYKGDRPAKFGVNGTDEILLERIPDALETMTREYEQARATVVLRDAEHRKAMAELDLAKERVEEAAARLKAEESRLKIALDAVRAAKNVEKPPPAKDGKSSFTIHIRPLTAGETTLWVETAGIKSALEAIAYASKDMGIKPEAVNVWIVRDKTVMPVDLDAIYKGDTKTNHAIKPGDQLFVQVKFAK